jgi:hypothetical protein
MRLNAPIAVGGEAVAVNFDCVAFDQDVALDQSEVNVERLGVACQRSYQIFGCNLGQAGSSRVASSLTRRDHPLVDI